LSKLGARRCARSTSKFNSELSSLLNKRQQDPRDPLAKTKFKKYQHYLTNDEKSDASPHEEDLTQLYLRKGYPKGLEKAQEKVKEKERMGSQMKAAFVPNSTDT
jgi:hypothetical protein